MDHSFGYNASSRPDDFLSRRDLLWLLTDVVASGGNLLLNGGPRGVDARISDEQLVRLDWLRAWVGTNGDAIHATRPWVTTGTTTGEQAHVRYTTRGDTVFALVQDAPPSITLPDLAPTPTTSVTTVTGDRLAWHATPAGLRVDLGRDTSEGGPTVVACGDVVAAPRPRP
jgi:alpha-L-fucosidase